MRYDYLIVGAGLYGATFARLAADAGRRVLVVEKRPHIGGNAYTERRGGIDVHVYGPHVFHTSDKAVWDFVRRFADFRSFAHSPVACYRGELYSLPFSMNTFEQMWGVATPEEAKAEIERQRRAAGITSPRNLEEQAVSMVGTDIYEKLIKGYTEKQWGKSCSELPAEIIKRIPVRFTRNNNYYDCRFQGIPSEGYTEMAARMLEGIEVRTGIDYLSRREELDALADSVVYTGPIDALFGCRFGRLAYRSIRFETEDLPVPDYQGCAVINHTDAETPWTRTTEHRWFAPEKPSDHTIVTREYSMSCGAGDEPFYPVRDGHSLALYGRYKELADSDPKLIAGGRLGEYRYYDMDETIASAMRRFDELSRSDLR